MRVNVNLPEDLIKKIDVKAKELFVSRSAYISMALAQKLQADELMSNFPALLGKMNELSIRMDKQEADGFQGFKD